MLPLNLLKIVLSYLNLNEEKKTLTPMEIEKRVADLAIKAKTEQKEVVVSKSTQLVTVKPTTNADIMDTLATIPENE